MQAKRVRFISVSLSRSRSLSQEDWHKLLGDSVSFSALAAIKALSGPAELDRFNFFQVSENQSFAAAALPAWPCKFGQVNFCLEATQILKVLVLGAKNRQRL